MKRNTVWVPVLVVFVLGVGTVVLAGGRLPAIPWFGGSCDIPTSIAPDAPSSAPATGGIQVVDHGFTQPADEFKSVSLGAVVENTSGSIAYHTRVTFRLMDAENRDVTGFDTTGDEIPILMPGQRVGVGVTASPASPEAASRKVAAIRVDAEATRWLSRDALGEDFGPVTADYRSTIRRNPRVPDSNEIHFVPKSDACRPLVGWNPVALFRDGTGAIVGGTRQYAYVTETCARSGEETWVVPRKAIPPAADDSHTEIYPYCDVR